MMPTVEEPFTAIAHDAAQASRASQVAWSRRPVAARLAILRKARHIMALRSTHFCDAISSDLARTQADTCVAEVLPLLDACRFLERYAAKVLKTRRLGRRGLALWLAGIDSQVERAAFGQILVIGPANYPLFLAGVQVLQALAAGNAVVWKPGRGGRAVAEVFASAMVDAGLPPGLLIVTEDTVAAGWDALAGRVNGVRPDKVVFTGSAETGRAILHELAETLTPCVAELSGCDAIVVLPSADLDRVVKAMVFGMRLNGSATCMAPRRLVLVGMSVAKRAKFASQLAAAFNAVNGIGLSDSIRRKLNALLAAAAHNGAEVRGVLEGVQRPVLITNVTAGMNIAQADLFAPVLAMIEANSVTEAREVVERCAYALTVAIFGDEKEARSLGTQITAGTVIINDVIVPTADARVPFGGRRKSGFGVTRGAEGLLEMTAPKTISVRRRGSLRHYETTGPEHKNLFDGLILATHAPTWALRWDGLKQMTYAARKMM